MILDPLYIILIVIGIAISGGASLMVKSRYKKGKETPIASGYTGSQVAEAILRDAGISDVTVHEHQGFLSDHYNPLNKTLNLSPEVYRGRSAASAGIAAHEVGHAIQHAQNYFPMWVRSAIVPVANIGSSLGPWLVIIGIILGAGAEAAGGSGIGHLIAVLGVALFAMATAFTLVTVPVEINASSRAKKQLMHLSIIRQGAEAKTVSSVLTAAGWTYVAAAINSILMLLYWAYKAGLIGGRRND